MDSSPPSLTLNLSDFTTRFKAEPGSIFIVSCPIGTRPEEMEAAAKGLEAALTMTGSCALFLPPGMKVETLVEESLAWVAREDLALRGYPVPGSQGETRYKVLHRKLGQLSDEPHWLTAIRTAQAALGPQEPPPPPLQADSTAVTRSGQ